jgi:hypothetical protein
LRRAFQGFLTLSGAVPIFFSFALAFISQQAWIFHDTAKYSQSLRLWRGIIQGNRVISVGKSLSSFLLHWDEFREVAVVVDLFKRAHVMLEQAATAIGTEAFQEELDALLLLVSVDDGVLLDQIFLSVSKLTLVSISARSPSHPVSAHFGLVEGGVWLFSLVGKNWSIIGVERGVKLLIWEIVLLHLPWHLLGSDIEGIRKQIRMGIPLGGSGKGAEWNGRLGLAFGLTRGFVGGDEGVTI